MTDEPWCGVCVWETLLEGSGGFGRSADLMAAVLVKEMLGVPGWPL